MISTVAERRKPKRRQPKGMINVEITEQWIVHATARELEVQLDDGTLSSEAIVTALLKRIGAIDSAGSDIALRSILAITPDALEAARRADDERSQGVVRSRLHGIPVVIKDNIEAIGLPGTAGATSLLGRPVTEDAPLVRSLREAGLIILGSTNLSQWANLRSPNSTSGWSSVGGLCVNPFRLDRSAGGSSSGSGAALAARLAPLAIGTETDGSITCPASLNGVVGLKPAVGTISGGGIVPISKSQDSAGPMARTVLDAAILYEVLTGRSDVVDRVEQGPDDLAIGVAVNLLTHHAPTDQLFQNLVAQASAQGFNLTEISVVESTPEVHTDELTVLLCEMSDDLGAFLARRGGDGPQSLPEVIDHENANAEVELAYFGHEFLEQAVATGGRAAPHYHEARDRNVAWATTTCLEPALRDVDCFIAPCYSPAWKNDLTLGGSGSARWSEVTLAAAIAGWPIATVPMGVIDGLPVGLSIVGRPSSEGVLLCVAHAFEKLVGPEITEHLIPSFLPPQRG